MTIYIDPPMWPAHGTVFSHVISDHSLSQLHDFAAAVQISHRAFDRDHYDVPAYRYQELIQQGAVPVTASELTRILHACGLRIPTAERPEKLRAGLSRRWQRLCPQSEDPAIISRWNQLGEDLLSRWSEPHRHYHALPHLAAVLRVIGILERAGELPQRRRRPVLLAAWFHDAVYAGQAGQDEEDSAQLAAAQLDGLLPHTEISNVMELIRLTASHQPAADDVAGAVLCDADLEVLAREPEAYRRYTEHVRADYAHIAEAEFAQGRAQVLRRLISAPRLFHTETGYQRWEEPARRNLTEELAQLLG